VTEPVYTPPPPVPNRYLGAIKAHRAASVGPAAELETLLDAAVSAWSAPAWYGSAQADAVSEATVYYKGQAAAAAQAALDTFDTKAAGEPELVEPYDWRARYGFFF